MAEQRENFEYRGTLGKLVTAAGAWRMCAIVLAIVAGLLAIAYVNAKGQQRTVLVPYGMASANSQAMVSGTIDNDGDYMDLLFRADIGVLLNWHATTVGKQLDVFMTRLTETAYSRLNLSLRTKATDYARDNVSEVFHPVNITKSTNADVPGVVYMEAKGILKRTQGDEEILNTNAVYTLTYTMGRLGIYAVDDIHVSSYGLDQGKMFVDAKKSSLLQEPH